MLTRRATLTAALIGAVIGILVLGSIFSLIDQWYASAASPLILLLAPGAIVGAALNPLGSEMYMVTVFTTQAASYALVTVATVALVCRARRGGTDVV